MTSKAHNNPINISVKCDDMKIGKFIINSYSNDDEVLSIEVGKKNIISAEDARDIALQYLGKIGALHKSYDVLGKYTLSDYIDKNDHIEVEVVKEEEAENAMIDWEDFISNALSKYERKFFIKGKKRINPSSYSAGALDHKRKLRERWITATRWRKFKPYYINVRCCDTSNKELLSEYIVEMSIMISRTTDTENYYFEVSVRNTFNVEVDEIELYSIMVQIPLIKGWFGTYRFMRTFAGREEYEHFLRALLQHVDKRFMLIDSIKDTAIMSKRSGSAYPGFLCDINNTTATRASPDEMERRVSDINIRKILTIPLYPQKY